MFDQMEGRMKGAIVFDLDGTLIDSAPDLHVALNKVLAGEGVAPVTLTETMGFIGHGIPSLVKQAREARGLPAERQPAMTEAMFTHYLAAPADLTRPYPGAVAFLQRLCEAGHPVGLCTNKALGPTMEILQRLELTGFFKVVIGGDSMAEKKPDPAPLRAAFAPLGAMPLVSVGDSEVDAETAARAGIPFALHLHGYRKAAPEALPHRMSFGDYAADDLYARILAIAG
jgi:phosphoglycolate phosphatase